MDKYCVESPQYGKDELKRLHFYCENCGKEILRDKQICYPAPKNEGEKIWEEKITAILNSFQMYCDTSLTPDKNPEGLDFYSAKKELSQLLKEAEDRGYVNRGVVEAKIKDGMIKEHERELKETEARGKKWNISWNEHLKQINLTKAQARQSAFAEIEKWADIYMPSELVKDPYDCGYRQALQELQSFIKENKTKI